LLKKKGLTKREVERSPQNNFFREILSLAELKKCSKKIMESGEDNIEKLVDLVFSQAILRRASDIHLEPQKDIVSVRYRIDGMLYSVMELPSSLKENLVIRIKVLSNLSVYKRNIPQDGRIEFHIEGIDLRVTTFPTIHGEKVIIRIFDSRKLRFKIEDLGFSAFVQKEFQTLISRPQGLILLTGPANSGKTTTLYAALEKIAETKSHSSSIVTVEDPIEYDFGTISQTQLGPSSGLSYSRALRSLMRQDPEVIMVGEIRDKETAEIVTQVGLTGHLVLSTIHSGTALSVFIRLIEMGIEPFLLASSISGVMAQRLVRVICPHCKETYSPSPEFLEKFGIKKQGLEFIHGKGCNKCLFQGYSGRTAIAELLVVNERFRQILLQKPTLSQLESLSREMKMPTLLEDGINKVKEGITTLEELKRVVLYPE